MSFDIKYDRNGNPIPSATVETALAAQAEAVETVTQPVEVQPEPEVVETQADDVVVDEPTAVAQPAETPQQKNFRAIKDRAERAERERDEYFRLLSQKELEKQSPQAQPEPEEDLSYHVDADALVEGKHLSKVDKKIQKLERQLAQYEQRSTSDQIEYKLTQEFKDFNAVVSKENIARFKEEQPELAQSLMANPDLYSKGKSAYMLLKKFGIATDPNLEADKALVMKNAAKPRPLVSVSPQQGDSPLSRANAFANGLTKELKEQLAREVAEARRNM